MVGIFLGVVSVGMGVGLVAYLSQQEQRVRRELMRIGATRVGDVADGAVVKIVGTVEGGRRREAPLSGRGCAFSSVVVEKRRGNWTSEMAREESGVDFWVRDETGVVRVVSERVESALAPWDRYVADEGRRDRYLSERKIECAFRWNVSAREAILTVGARVAVAGVARWEMASDGASGYRDDARTLTLRGSADAPILLSDDATG